MSKNKWKAIGFAFRWPHQGVLLGFEFYDEDENNPYSSLRFHFLLVSIHIDSGSGQLPFA